MKFKLLLVCVGLTAACTVNFPVSDSNANSASETPASQGAKELEQEEVPKDSNPATQTVANNCPDVRRVGKIQVKSQSFPFSFKPFMNMCFVTFADTELMVDERDVPRGSTFHLYQNGQSVLDLPDAFDGMEGCWVEGVSFKDLNNDGLTDIIIAGSCLAARDSYPANAVFVNNGTDFETDAAANMRLEDLRKLSEIEAFARKNQKLFF